MSFHILNYWLHKHILFPIFFLARIEHMFYNESTRDFERVFLREGRGAMDYKQLLLDLIERATDMEMLELIYRFAKKLLD